MRLGVLTVILSNEPFDKAAKYLSGLGVGAVELGCGGYPGDAHCKPKELLSSEAKIKDLKKILEDNGLIISALSTHGNPTHPNKDEAKKFHDDFEAAVCLAEKLNVETVITFSGCPGDHEGAKYPNWVTCPWPPDFLDILDYQWDSVLIPYWKKTAEFAKNRGVKNIALEMHPGFCVYNPETLLKLRNAVDGKTIGANFDPSHLWWQGMDPVKAVMELGPAIQHFHAKDVRVDKYTTAANGVLDTKHYTQEAERSWVFRSVGYGHDMQTWRDIVSALRLVGYDHVMSIEHEDSLMSAKEGLEKAVDFLKKAMVFEPKPTSISWA
ncbi:MAG: sugar phosphate isomerase/epimerase [Oscillospiraceae bacterium]|nr:sugar phosphate isomerase/epimerase [Oscillospiraceae bacterium]